MAQKTLMHPECLSLECAQTLSVMKEIAASHGLTLAGGTALALRIGHRKSVDLDFFTEREFSTDGVFRMMKKAGLAPSVLQETEGSLSVATNGVKVSVFHYPYAFIEGRTEWKGIRLAGTIDIAAMKVIAISQRGAKRDFVDLYFIMRDTPFRKVAENMALRYGPDRINPINIGKGLVYFADAEPDPEPLYLCKDAPGWEKIKKFFTRNMKQMVYDIQNAVEG